MDFHRIKKKLQTEHTLPADDWKGAVLFLCNDKHVFLIKRSEKMPTHSGQMAFVGGHKKTDEATPWEVVQREYEEETSLLRESIEFLGYLPVVMTARLRPIVPVMSRLLMNSNEFLTRARSNGEWDQILAYPWSELQQEANWEFAWRNGYTRCPVMFHTIKSSVYLSPSENQHAHLLWGATASMIWDFLRLYFNGNVGPY